MFASTLFADDGDRRDFERRVESLLREGHADDAARIVEAALGELARTEHWIAPMCLGCTVEDIELVGWDRLAERIARIGEANGPITALGIDLRWPGRIDPDAEPLLEPALETNYYSDASFGFSSSSRDALLAGYRPSGCEWAGGFEDIDSVIELRGLGQIYGAVAPLLERLRGQPGDDPTESDAMRLGALFVAVRVHQAVLRAVATRGLPQPLTVLVGSNESYPYLDAPVVSFAESAEFVAALPADSALQAEPEAEPTTCLMPSETAHPSGSTLRKRFAASEPANDEVAAPNERRLDVGGKLARLFRR